MKNDAHLREHFIRRLQEFGVGRRYDRRSDRSRCRRARRRYALPGCRGDSQGEHEKKPGQPIHPCLLNIGYEK